MNRPVRSSAPLAPCVAQAVIVGVVVFAASGRAAAALVQLGVVGCLTLMVLAAVDPALFHALLRPVLG